MQASRSPVPSPAQSAPVSAHETWLLRELNDASREIHRSLSLDAVLRVVTDSARRIVGSRHAVTSLAGRGDDEPSLAVSSGAAHGHPTHVRASDLGLHAKVCRQNIPMRLTPDQVSASEAWSRLVEDPERSLPPGGWLAAPLVASDGSNLGSIQLTDKADGTFTEADEATLVQLAQMAAVAVENARLYETALDARGRLAWTARVERLRAAELRAVIEAMGDAVFLCDAHGTVRLTNPAADEVFTDRPVRDLDDLLSRFEGGRTGDLSAGPVELRLRQRPRRWMELSRYDVDGPVGSDAAGSDLSGWIVVMRDVTEARDAQAQREAFLGILSHELRTPITTIYAGSKVLAREPRLAGETRNDLAADISSEAERLYRLVEDLLVMSRAERGVLELAWEPILLQRVAVDAMRLEAANWPGTTFTFDAPDDLPAIAGDQTYVEQVVRNLLSNAAKYGPPDATVEVVLTPVDGSIVLRVLDRGAGFGETEGDDLFELFYRSPATAAQHAGAGIGLFVCRRLVEAMDGRIWARPRPGGGSEFGFSLPFWRED
jgi:signal transduction histidine kinase